MTSLIQEINVVIVRQNNINIDLLNRAEIKRILAEGYDNPPKYVELPGLAIFDYLNNPDFPVQVNIQGRKEAFVLNGNASIHLEDDQTIRDFLEKFVSIDIGTSIAGADNPRVALGFNIVVAVTYEPNENPFSGSMPNFEGIFDNKGEMFASGFKIVRSQRNSRFEFLLNPVIPDMGADFLESYTVRANLHREPIPSAWDTNLVEDVIGFKNDVVSSLSQNQE